jgi:hypothetical protein
MVRRLVKCLVIIAIPFDLEQIFVELYRGLGIVLTSEDIIVPCSHKITFDSTLVFIITIVVIFVIILVYSSSSGNM